MVLILWYLPMYFFYSSSVPAVSNPYASIQCKKERGKVRRRPLLKRVLTYPGGFFFYILLCIS